MSLKMILSELTACGFAVALSPLDIALVLLLLLGSSPLLKSSLFSGAWFITNSIAIALLVTVGKGLTLSMEKGGIHQVGIDLFAAGALLALGMRELNPKPKDFKDVQGSWISKLEKVGQLPLTLLLLTAPLTLLLNPDNLFLLAKAAAVVQGGQQSQTIELGLIAYFSLISSTLLLVPIFLVLIGKQQVQPLLEQGKKMIEQRSSLILGVISMGLAAYLGWSGWTGLSGFTAIS